MSLHRVIRGILIAVVFSVWAVVLPLGLVSVFLLRMQVLVFPHAESSCRFLIQGFLFVWLGMLRISRLIVNEHPKGQAPKEACVIVANHPGLLDVLYLMQEIPGVSVMVKRSLTHWLPLAPIVRQCGYILSPDYRSTPLETMRDAVKTLRSGRSFMLFPEGTRSPKGGLLRFKPGAFKIAQMAGVPILPVFVRHEPPFLPHEDTWYYPPPGTSRIRLEFWEPIPPPAEGEERQAARELERRYREALGLAQKDGAE